MNNMTLESFNLLVIIWTGFAILLFPVILKIPAPYGRHARSNWGPMINNKLGWFLMEAPALFIFVYFIIKGKSYQQNSIQIFALLWIIHYFNRVIIFPLRIRTKGKKMPLVIMVFALFFNLINGFINGYWFGELSPSYSPSWFADPRFIFGALLFVTGFFINQFHDRILIALRKNSTSGYKVPHGGLFKYISCPNFLGEIVEWAGFAMMTWCLPTLSFFIWTMVNLIPRALDHHKWYQKTFTDYPANRKAIFPEIL
jgi:3-oxo-5-alpha-steroid 4-dehydrogenase 1